jgi:hypothetical protein
LDSLPVLREEIEGKNLKPFLFALIILITVSLTSAVWHSRQAHNREQIKHLNFTIQDQQETMYRMRLEIRKNWKLKNEAWSELSRRER